MERLHKEQQSNIAWYKLAELVSRGEKEKALNLYRLLAHSLADRAYAVQVEGDLLWAFEDADALKIYHDAARLYEEEKNYTAAAAIYEHLCTLEPTNKTFLSGRVMLYVTNDKREHFFSAFDQLVTHYQKDAAGEKALQELIVTVVTRLQERTPAQEFQLTVKDFVQFLTERAPELARVARDQRES